MFSRILSVLLVICLTLSTSVTALAQNSGCTYPQEQNKSVSYIEGCRLVLWESGNIVYAEQYSSQGNLIVSGKANRTNGEIVLSGAISNNFNAKDIVKTISTTSLPSSLFF